MIDGFKTHVPAAEFKELCLKRAEYHNSRAARYERQVEAIKKVNEEEVTGSTEEEQTRNFSNSKLLDSTSRVKSARMAAELMSFAAAHVQEGEVYVLNEHELFKLGIGSED